MIEPTHGQKRESKMVKGTTILSVRHKDKVVVAGDGQVTLDTTVIKHRARKVRKLYNGRVLAGFAGSAADAFTLYEKFESKLEQYKGNLSRAAVELAKEWRSDRILRRLDALLAVFDKDHCYVISGQGEVIEPDDNVVAIGSGGDFALAAARALLRFSNLSAAEIVEESIRISASICVYTNENITVVEL